MASLDISQLRNVSSDVIRSAERTNSKVYNVLGPQDDNNSFSSIFDRAMENINTTIEELGLTGTRLNRMLFRPELSRQGIQNYVSAVDMGKILQGLLAGEIVSAQASARMLEILGDQRLNGKLPFYLHSRDIDCAHKTGEDSGITHDVGVIFGDETCVVCFLSNETDVPLAERAIQDIGAMVAGIS